MRVFLAGSASKALVNLILEPDIDCMCNDNLNIHINYALKLMILTNWELNDVG